MCSERLTELFSRFEYNSTILNAIVLVSDIIYTACISIRDQLSLSSFTFKEFIFVHVSVNKIHCRCLPTIFCSLLYTKI